jgi:hypothetical protein
LKGKEQSLGLLSDVTVFWDTAMLVEELQTFLAAATAVTALLGTPSSRSDSTNGLFPVEALDGPALTMPYICYSQADGEPLAETMVGTAPLRQAHWMLSCYGSNYKQAKKLAQIVKDTLLAVPPNAVPTTQGVWLRREADSKIPIGKGTMFVTDLTFLVIFNETA